MKTVKMVLVRSEGILGFIISENKYGALVRYYVDGLGYTSFMESEEYVVKFIGEIDG